MGFTEVTRPYKASNLPGYRGFCPQLKFECGHTYGIATDKLTTRHTRNEKLVPLALENTAERELFLPKPNGDSRLTADIVPGYTGYVPTKRFLYGTRYKEESEQAISNFMKKDKKHRTELETLKTAVYSYPKLRVIANSREPSMYPDLRPRYSKYYFPSEHRDFTEPPLPGYTGYVPRRREHDLGTRYGTWTKEGFNESLEMRRKKEYLVTQTVKPSATLQATTKSVVPEHGFIYKTTGMKPKYTGYIPQRRFKFGNTYGDTTRSLPICFDIKGYSSAEYITMPVM